jgi:hypothetical protein
MMEEFPEVLGCLINHTCVNYATAGVQYVEYSVSTKDLLDKLKRNVLLSNPALYGDQYPAPPGPPPVPVGGQEGVTQNISSPLSVQTEPDDTTMGVDSDSSPSTTEPCGARTKLRSVSAVVASLEATGARNEKLPIVKFLAAFPRDKPSTVYFKIQRNGTWLQAAPPTTHKGAYRLLADTAQETAGIEAFLVAALPAEDRQGLVDSLLDAEEHDRVCLRLKALAKILCTDNYVARVYPDYVGGIVNTVNRLGCAMRTDPKLAKAVVGLDWLGDELGHPFCPFSHDLFINLVATRMCGRDVTTNPRFGVRIHAGEGPIRPSMRERQDSKLRLAFYLHMYIVTEGIKLYHKKLTTKLAAMGHADLKPCIRIGHGVAFLWGSDQINGHVRRQDRQFVDDMAAFREFL